MDWIPCARCTRQQPITKSSPDSVSITEQNTITGRFPSRWCIVGSLVYVTEIVRLDFIGQHFRSALLQKGTTIPDTHYEAPAMKQTIVPFRNGILLATAAGFAESVGASAIVIAAHAGDHAIFPDCRAEFVDAMSQAISRGTDGGVEIVRPFIGLSKAQIVQRGEALRVNLAETWTCYKGGERHCGTCGACVERREAFSLANIPTLLFMTIDSRLHRIVAAQPYPLLFATISGAHLYGFPSPDSDFDLRGAHVLPLDKVVGLDVHDETIPGLALLKGWRWTL